MGQASKEDSYNEDFAIFFEGELVGEADGVFRLAHAYTLNAELAFNIVVETFKGVIKDLHVLVKCDPVEVRRRLFSDCINLLRDEKNFKSPDKSNLVEFLRPFDSDERAALIMVELGGMTVNEASKIVRKEEVWVRRALAKVRKQLVSFADQ